MPYTAERTLFLIFHWGLNLAINFTTVRELHASECDIVKSSSRLACSTMSHFLFTSFVDALVRSDEYLDQAAKIRLKLNTLPFGKVDHNPILVLLICFSSRVMRDDHP